MAHREAASRRSRISSRCGGASASTPCPSAAYFANYTQDNHWFFTNILTDVRRHSHVPRPGGHPAGRHPGHRHQERIPEPVHVRLRERDGSDHDRIGRAGRRDPAHRPAPRRSRRAGRVRRLRAESENTSTFDLDGNPATTYDNETFGNSSFRHFTKNITDWSARWDSTTGSTNTLGLRGRRAGLQDAGAGRVPASDGPGSRWTCSSPGRCSRSRAA